MNKFITVANPREYVCLVENYAIGHREMGLTVFHEKENDGKFYIFFFDVFFFSGALTWKSVLCRIGTDKEYLRFMRFMVPYRNEHPAKQLLAKKSLNLNLYIFETENAPVRIVAGNAEQHRQRR